MAQPLLTLAAAVASLVTVGAALVASDTTAAVDARAYDRLLEPGTVSPGTSRVAVVAVDDASIGAVGQWPWPRDVMARLVQSLHDLGASVVALDMLFAEPDRLAGGGASEPGPTDARFADAIRDGRVALGYAFTFNTSGHTPPRCNPRPLPTTLVSGPGREAPEHRLFRAADAVCSLEALTAAAAVSGFLNVGVDTDGTLRRLPLVIAQEGHAGRVYPSLSLAAVHLALGSPPLTVAAPGERPLVLTMGDRTIGLDERGTMGLRFRGRERGFAHIPAGDVLNGRVAPGALDGRIVFVGATALGVRDVVATPGNAQRPGIEIHATAAENLLAGTSIASAPYHRVIETSVALLLALLVAITGGWAGYRWGAATAVVAAAACWFGSGWLLQHGNTYVSPVVPVGSVLVSFATLALVGIELERRRAEREGRRRRQAHEFVVRSLTSLMEMRDASTGRHARRTQGYSRLLAQRLAHTPDFRDYLTSERIEFISLLAPLHDIGKVGIRDAVLNKPSPLTPEELQEMRLHPVYGFETISKTQRQVGIDSGQDAAVLQLAKDIVYTHHERWDGTGYPRGLSGPEIPVAGRIMALVDVYDALVEPRPYRRRLRHQEAVELILAGRGTQFDPLVVEAFLTVEPDFLELGTRLREAPSHLTH